MIPIVTTSMSGNGSLIFPWLPVWRWDTGLQARYNQPDQSEARNYGALDLVLSRIGGYFEKIGKIGGRVAGSIA